MLYLLRQSLANLHNATRLKFIILLSTCHMTSIMCICFLKNKHKYKKKCFFGFKNMVFPINAKITTAIQREWGSLKVVPFSNTKKVAQLIRIFQNFS